MDNTESTSTGFDAVAKERQLRAESDSWDTTRLEDAREGDIPVIDLQAYFSDPRAGTLQPVADQLRDACEGVGFFSIVGHQVQDTLIDLIATGLRLVPSIDMPVSKLAKWKTAIEMVGIGGLLLAMGAGLAWLWSVSLVALWLAAVLAVYTLGLYVGALIAESKRPHS